MLVDNVTRPLAKAVAPTTVRGIEHLAHVEGPVIFAANHASHVDTPLLLTTLPLRFRHRTVVAGASDYFFDRTWKAILWSFALAAIPIERSKVNRKSADTAAELIEDGWNLIIFPEGGRSPDGWAQPFKGGAAYLSRRTGRPVVPVYLHGTRAVLSKGATRLHPEGGSGTESARSGGLRRARVSILFGSPLLNLEHEDARRFGARIEAAVSELANEVDSDWWQARRHSTGAEALSGPVATSWRRQWALGPSPRDVVTPTEPVWPPE
jgi:1-acyl-sn-glycerol-3-phosphate acyltransferase